LLASARKLLASDPAASIGLLRQHAALYPNGMLSQERDVLLIDAKARMGKIEEARKSAEDFLRDNPDSAHGTKVRESAFGDASTDRNSRP
jgi:outer membrane protein assembly factor BamD (BamD/ComL family)